VQQVKPREEAWTQQLDQHGARSDDEVHRWQESQSRALQLQPQKASADRHLCQVSCVHVSASDGS
jgi:hypothetical protein